MRIDLEILNLACNELHDQGIDSIVTLMMEDHLQNIQEIHMQNNHITDHGFSKVAKVLISIQEMKYSVISVPNSISAHIWTQPNPIFNW